MLTITIDQKNLDEAYLRALKGLEDSVNHGLPLQFSDQEATAWRSFVGTYEAIYSQLSRSQEKEEDRSMTSMFAVYAAAKHTIQTFNLTNSKNMQPQLSFVDGRKSERFYNLFSNSVQEYLSKENREEYLGSLLHGMAAVAQSTAHTQNYLSKNFRSLEIIVGSNKYGSFLEKIKTSQKEQVIGNDAMMNSLHAALFALCHYNGKTNPLLEYLTIPRTVNIHGPPGSGKTTGIRIAYNEAVETYGKMMKVPLELIVLDNNFKTSLFSESAKQITNLFAKINKGEAAYLVVIDDVETVLHSRDTYSSEERNITHTMMNELDGLLTKYRGNYLLTTTTNFPLTLDPALDRRLSDLVLHAPGPTTVEEYIQTFQYHLRQGIEKGYVSIDNWPTIGDIAAAVRMQGRNPVSMTGNDIKKITVNFNGKTILPAMKNGHLYSPSELKETFSRILINTPILCNAIQSYATHYNERS